MITLSTLHLLYDYHYWANARLLRPCEALTPEQWDRSLGHSWDSVHGLAVHMLAAETIWLARWQGESPHALRKPAEFPTLGDVRREWDRVEADMRAFLEECSDARINEPLTYTNTRGETHTAMLGHLMLHVANHGTHHRGELAAMLALLNVVHPEEDLLFYVLEQRHVRNAG
jgi:uncharacterized damage-inducible protein DinB